MRRAEWRALLLLAALVVLGSGLGGILPHGQWFRPGGFSAGASGWDAQIYDDIARQGYGGADQGAPATRIAFFPGWPLLLRLCLWSAGTIGSANSLAIIVNAAIGAASVFAFGRLARATLSPSAAAPAITAYALYPGAHWFFQPYPTAIMQLCTILTLTELVRRRPWRAAIVSGVATAFGPLMAFVAASVSLTGLIRAWRARRQAPGSFGRFCLSFPLLCALSLAGLLIFIVWQGDVFGAPLAFVTAGKTWETPMPLSAHAMRALAMLLVFPDLIRLAARLWLAASLTGQHQFTDAQISYEDAADLLVLFFMSLGAIAALRLDCRAPAGAALLVIAGFIWFAGAPQGGQAAIRLIYPAIASFLAFGAAASRFPRLSRLLLSVSATLLVVDQALLMAGYWVV